MNKITPFLWFNDNAGEGWASCPITQNGCLRIMSNPRYPNALPVKAIAARLAELCANPVHEFWPDDISFVDSRSVDVGRIHSPGQITDLYLLALAVRHGGRLVTFDSAMALSAAKGASAQHVVTL